MNAMNDRAQRERNASDRASRIREIRERTMAKRPNLNCCKQQPVVVGMVGNRLLIDGGRQFGRGYCYWLKPAHDRRAA